MRGVWSPNAIVAKWNLIRAWQMDDDDFVAALQPLDGAIVTGSPSTLELLSSRLPAVETADAPRPALVVLSGETVTPELRRIIAKKLDCGVVSVYAMGEVGILGPECPEGGYHVDNRVAIVEVLTENGHPTPNGEPGKLTVTTLANQAMPLVRYQPGDRVRAVGPCTCGHSGQRLELEHVRVARWLITDTGSLVNTVRFAKLWRSIGVQSATLLQQADGGVQVFYRAPHPFNAGQFLLVIAGVRAAVGMRTAVTLTWLAEDQPAPPSDSPRPATEALPESRRELSAGIAAWLRDRIPPEDAKAVVITGSSVNSATMTRFSDIDVTVFVDGDAARVACLWIDRIRALREEVPALRVIVESTRGLASRSPMVAARLRCEQLLVAGALPPQLTRWPRRSRLLRDARTWASQALPVVWHLLTAPDVESRDVVEVAYFAQKHIINACRYAHLINGGRVTQADEVVAARLQEMLSARHHANAVEAIRVARETAPAPPLGEGAATRYLSAASAAVRTLVGTV